MRCALRCFFLVSLVITLLSEGQPAAARSTEMSATRWVGASAKTLVRTSKVTSAAPSLEAPNAPSQEKKEQPSDHDTNHKPSWEGSGMAVVSAVPSSEVAAPWSVTVIQAVHEVLSWMTKGGVTVIAHILDLGQTLARAVDDAHLYFSLVVGAFERLQAVGFFTELAVGLAMGGVVCWGGIWFWRDAMPSAVRMTIVPSPLLLLRSRLRRCLLVCLPPLAGGLVASGTFLAFHQAGQMPGAGLDRALLALALHHIGAIFFLVLCFRVPFVMATIPAIPGLPPAPVHRTMLVMAWRCGATLVAFGWAFHESLGYLGLPGGLRDFFLKVLTLPIFIAFSMVVLGLRATVSRWIEQEKNRPSAPVFARARSVLARWWHRAILTVLLISYVQWVLKFDAALQQLFHATLTTLLILVLTKAIRWLVSSGFHHIETSYKSPLRQALHQADAGGGWHLSLRHVSYLEHFIDVIIYAVAFLAALDAWHIGLGPWLKSASGQEAFVQGLTLVMILLSALSLWEFIEILVHRRMLEPASREGENTPRVSMRMKTLLLLLQTILKSVIAVVTTVLVLGQLGLNIAVVVAGFGVVGIAFAMGSQRLIQDFVTGLFILLDRSLEIGSVVMVAGVGGKIQSFTLRSVRMVSHNGLVHIVPYSHIDTIATLSDHTMTLIEVEVATYADLSRVEALIQDVATEMKRDPAQVPKIISDAAVFGISSTNESLMIVTAEIISEPDPRKDVERVFRLRVHRKLIEQGIPMPTLRQNVTLAPPEASCLPFPIVVTQAS